MRNTANQLFLRCCNSTFESQLKGGLRYTCVGSRGSNFSPSVRPLKWTMWGGMFGRLQAHEHDPGVLHGGLDGAEECDGLAAVH
jgi:hypothetical protein